MSGGPLDAITGALIEARASPEAINAAVVAYEASERAPRPRGRPRKYVDNEPERFGSVVRPAGHEWDEFVGG